MAKLVSNDAQWLAVGSGESGGSNSGSESALDAGRSEVSTVLGEHEIDGSAVTGVWERALLLSVSEPFIERVEGGGVEGDDTFVVEFAEWDAQPAAGWAVVDDRVEFEVQQFADAEPGPVPAVGARFPA